MQGRGRGSNIWDSEEASKHRESYNNKEHCKGVAQALPALQYNQTKGFTEDNLSWRFLEATGLETSYAALPSLLASLQEVLTMQMTLLG